MIVSVLALGVSTGCGTRSTSQEVRLCTDLAMIRLRMTNQSVFLAVLGVRTVTAKIVAAELTAAGVSAKPWDQLPPGQEAFECMKDATVLGFVDLHGHRTVQP